MSENERLRRLCEQYIHKSGEVEINRLKKKFTK
jgi:hypothetical protein